MNEKIKNKSAGKMNLTEFCEFYNLSYDIVRPLVNKALLENRDDCVLVAGKQKISILDDKKFITFINDLKRRELKCQYQKRTQEDFTRIGMDTTYSTTSTTANAVALQLEKKIYGMR
jgi:hypothetical protein